MPKPFEADLDAEPEVNAGGFGDENLLVSLGKKEKYFASSLVAVAVLVLVLGFWQMGRAIKSPFEPKNQNTAAANNVNQLDQATIDELKSKDTDHDGLSDYDEQYVYGTSPYIADTDSDGISDGDEVKAGKNPLCPEGSDCSAKDFITGENVNADANINSATGAITGGPTPAASVDASDLTNEMMSGIDYQAIRNQVLSPAGIRQAMIAAGVDSNLVSQLTDDQVLALYNQMVASGSATASGANTNSNSGLNLNTSTNSGTLNTNTSSGATNTNTTIDPNSPEGKAQFLQTVQAMTGAEVRQLLQSSGVDLSKHQNATDDELKQFLIQTIQSQP